MSILNGWAINTKDLKGVADPEGNFASYEYPQDCSGSRSDSTREGLKPVS